MTSVPAGIDCGTQCRSQSASYARGTVVTLTAEAVPGALFQGWTKDCSGNGLCVLTMDEDKDVFVHFRPNSGVASPPGTSATASVVLRSHLALAGGRGDVSVGGSAVSVGAGVETEVALNAGPGEHVVEAWVREGVGEGVWRFALSATASGRSIRSVLAGEPVSLTPEAVVFRLRGRLPQKVAFVVTVGAPDGETAHAR